MERYHYIAFESMDQPPFRCTDTHLPNDPRLLQDRELKRRKTKNLPTPLYP